MRILDRYVLRAYWRFFRLTAGAMLAIIFIVDLFEQIDDIIENDVGIFSAAAYFATNLPVVGFRLLPMISLVAAVLGLGALARDSEVIAMRAGGVSLYRTVLPLLQMGIVLTVLTFLFGEMVFPQLHAKADQIKATNIKKDTPSEDLQRTNIWLRGKDRRMYYAREFEPAQRALLDVSIFEFDPAYRLIRRTDVGRMERLGDGWVLTDVVEYRIAEGGEVEVSRAATERVQLPETLEAFRRVKKRPADMNAVELRRYIRRMEAEGGEVSALRSDLQAKFAMPFSVVVLILLAIPYGVHNPRTGGIGRSLAIGLGLAIAYWFVMQIGLSLGHAGKLPPIFAAWLGNLFFATLGLYLMIHVRQ
ncbi:MAG: LPS export ABC transporter permease LptG [Nitrospirota bacterium]